MSTDPQNPAEPAAPVDERPRRRPAVTAFSPGGWARRSARLWGFFGFAILVIVLARHVILPFVFALLLAYILAPVVQWMSERKDGGRRMPRGLAILLCYLVLIAFIASFLGLLLPRLSKDAARIGRELPGLYQKLNEEWAPQAAVWVEQRFPAVEPAEAIAVEPLIADVPMPPGTAFVLTPLPDGRFAVQVQSAGIDVTPLAGGGFTMESREADDEPYALEDRIRGWVAEALSGLQAELGDFFRFGQAILAGLVASVFTFFLVLMVCAFILIDLEKIHGFVRGLVPAVYRDDYDKITAGMNRGLSGVIRGQLVICLVNGVLTYVGLMIFQVKYALILAVVAAVMSLIPIFGSILSTIPIVFAALVSGDEGINVTRAFFALAWVVGIHFIEGNFLNPKIIGSSAKIHPVLVIFALIVGEHTYGLVGALLAVPVLSMIQVLFLYVRHKAWMRDAALSGPRRREPATPEGPVPPRGLPLG